MGNYLYLTPMTRLYDLLKDRTAIRILKALYDHEASKKNSYTLHLNEISRSLGLADYPKESAENLSGFGLVAMDTVNGDIVMSITNKGKDFIEIFDQLIELFMPEKVGKKMISVKYELTIQEKKILVLSYKISKESGSDFIAMNTLVQELYPYNQSGKASAVSRHISKLEEINLMSRKKEDKEILVSVTDKGLKTIREQYLKELMR